MVLLRSYPPKGNANLSCTLLFRSLWSRRQSVISLLKFPQADHLPYPSQNCHHESYKQSIVLFYNAKGDNEQLGGLVNTQVVTNKNFHEMLEILLVFDSPYTLTLASDDIVPKDGAELQLGEYYVDGNSKTLA